MGVDTPLIPNPQCPWRVSELNRQYRLCSSYPSVLATPRRMPDQAGSFCECDGHSIMKVMIAEVSMRPLKTMQLPEPSHTPWAMGLPWSLISWLDSCDSARLFGKWLPSGSVAVYQH